MLGHLCFAKHSKLISLFHTSKQRYLQSNNRTALEAIYQATNGDEWLDNENWMNGGDPCNDVEQWAGVICNTVDDPNTIMYLNLKENNLSGTIPSEIALLSDLRGLELDSNSLSGTIPSEIGRLSKLQVLLLDENSLEGDIPSEIGMLDDVWLLRLNENSFSSTFPDILGDLSSLFYLFLQDNEITGTVVCDNAPSQVMRISADCVGNFPEVICDCCDGCSRPSSAPTDIPSPAPSISPTFQHSALPSHSPSSAPTDKPSAALSISPTFQPSALPNHSPSSTPSSRPSITASMEPSSSPTTSPSESPATRPTTTPSVTPTSSPTVTQTYTPTVTRSKSPTVEPTESPSIHFSSNPSNVPSGSPSMTRYITTVVNMTYTRESNSTDDTTNDDIQQVLSSEDEGLLAFFGDSSRFSSCQDESCRRLQRSLQGTTNEPFQVVGVSSTIDDTKTCESKNVENKCHHIVTSISAIHNLSLFPVDFAVLMVASVTSSYMDERLITIDAPPKQVRTLTTFVFSGVNSEEMTETEVDMFVISTSQFLRQSLAQSNPPVLVSAVDFDSQTIRQDGDDILDARYFLRANVTADTINESRPELAVNMTISAEYLPPPEIDFSATVVEIFSEEGTDEYLHELEESGNEYFQSTPENIIAVKVVSVPVEIEPMISELNDGGEGDDSNNEVLDMNALIAIIAASSFIALILVLLLWKKHQSKKSSEEMTENIRFSHQSMRNLMAASQRRLELESRSSMTTRQMSDNGLIDEGVSNNGSSRHIHENSMRQITGCSQES